MLFLKAKKLDWQHIALISVVCAAISLLVMALMAVLPGYLLNFVYAKGLFFLYSWATMLMFLLGICAQILVVFGPPVFYTVRHKKIEYGMRILFSSLVMILLLTLIVIAVCYGAAQMGWIDTVSYDELLY